MYSQQQFLANIVNLPVTFTQKIKVSEIFVNKLYYFQYRPTLVKTCFGGCLHSDDQLPPLPQVQTLTEIIFKKN